MFSCWNKSGFAIASMALAMFVVLAGGCGGEESYSSGDVAGQDTSLPDAAADVASEDMMVAPELQEDQGAGDTVASDVVDGDDSSGSDVGVEEDEGSLPDLEEPEDKWAYCDALADFNCVEIIKGESVFYQKLDRHNAIEFDDKGTPRTVVRLSDLIESDIVATPTAWRYQIFGTDGFTFGGFAEWNHLQQGYMELGSRRVVWEPVLELPDSWRVKDSSRIVLSPSGN